LDPTVLLDFLVAFASARCVFSFGRITLPGGRPRDVVVVLDQKVTAGQGHSIRSVPPPDGPAQAPIFRRSKSKKQ